MTASPSITTPRSSRWSSVSRSERSSSSDMSECVWRPWSGQGERHAVRAVARVELAAQVLQERFLVAVDEHINLRKRAAALLARFGNGLAAEAIEDGALDVGEELLLR